MASLLRIIALNPLAKFSQLNSAALLIEKLTHRQLNTNAIASEIQLFFNDRSSKIQSSDLERSKQYLLDSLRIDRPTYATTKPSVDIRNSLLDVIFTTKSEQETEFLIKCIQKNAHNIQSDLNIFLVGSNLMKLFYLLNLTDKSIQLFNDPKTQHLFLNRETILMLIKNLADQKRYSELIEAYEFYLNKMTDKSRQYILNEHLDIFVKAIFLQNGSQSVAKLKSFLLKLEENKFELSIPAIVYSILLFFQRNEIESARLLIERVSNYKLKPSRFLMENLKCINLAASNQNDTAFKQIEQMITDNYNLFPMTLDCLAESIKNSRSSELLSKFKNLKQKLEKQNRISRLNLVEYADLLANRKDQLKQLKRSLPPQSTGNLETKKEIQPLNVLPPASMVEIASVNQNPSSSIVNFQDLFVQKKYDELVNKFEKEFDPAKNIDADQFKLVTHSLYKLNSKKSFIKTKRIIEKLNNHETKLNDCSKLEICLLALNQNEPYYAIGLITLMGVEKSSQTIYINLRAAALGKLNRLNEAIDTLKSFCINIPKNMFTNDGLIFPYTLECLKQASQQSSTDQINSFIENLKSQDRISKLDLLDFVCNEKTNSDSKPTKKNTDSENQLKTNLEPLVTKEVNKTIVVNTISQTELDVSTQISKYYHECRFDQVIDYFVNNSQTKMSRECSEFLSKSVVKSALDVDRLKEVVDLLAKNDCELSFNSIIDYFLKFIQLNEPLAALSFLADHDPKEKLKTFRPSIYKNLLAIGFLAINRKDIAIEQIESLFKIPMKKALKFKYDGRLFPITLKHLKWCLENTTDPSEIKKLEDLIKQCSDEKRLCTIDLNDASSL